MVCLDQSKYIKVGVALHCVGYGIAPPPLKLANISLTPAVSVVFCRSAARDGFLVVFEVH